jgi:hypothetical protein
MQLFNWTATKHIPRIGSPANPQRSFPCAAACPRRHFPPPRHAASQTSPCAHRALYRTASMRPAHETRVFWTSESATARPVISSQGTHHQPQLVGGFNLLGASLSIFKTYICSSSLSAILQNFFVWRDRPPVVQVGLSPEVLSEVKILGVKNWSRPTSPHTVKVTSIVTSYHGICHTVKCTCFFSFLTGPRGTL